MTAFVRHRHRFNCLKFRKFDSMTRSNYYYWFGHSLYDIKRLYTQHRIPDSFTAYIKLCFWMWEILCNINTSFDEGDTFSQRWLFTPLVDIHTMFWRHLIPWQVIYISAVTTGINLFIWVCQMLKSIGA